MTKKKILLVCGTRPEIIKMAPVYEALQRSASLAPVVLHTGQHTDLAAPMYSFFGMPPDLSIELERKDASLHALCAALLERLGAAIPRVAPSVVLVQGDTSSATMAAMAAFFEKIPVGHVEAGLRTHDIYAPFPEEMNRTLIGRIATWHYAPTELAARALLAEGIAPQRVLTTGNTVIDAARQTAERLDRGHPPEAIEALGIVDRLKGHRLAVVTAHRRENWGEGIAQIAHGIADLLAQQPDLLVVWALHANPAVSGTVRETLAQRQVDGDRLVLAGHLEYPALIWLLHRAWLVLTDSGGIQEEAAAFGVPVLVLRDQTERTELIAAGGGRIIGADSARILAASNELQHDAGMYSRMRNIVNPFGDGRAAERIVQSLEAGLAPA